MSVYSDIMGVNYLLLKKIIAFCGEVISNRTLAGKFLYLEIHEIPCLKPLPGIKYAKK